MSNKQPPRIIIVGGGAGGLELVTQLGNTLGKQKLAHIILVDSQLTHVWKPLWHEVAAGTLMTSEDEVNYIVHAFHHHFEFQQGSLQGLNRQHKQITLAAVTDSAGQEILPERALNYDKLVIAIGSVSHDFNIPGVKDYCYSLDSYQDCRHFHQQFLKNLMRLQEQLQSELTIAIIGAGATGVELAAELEFACQQALNYTHQSVSNRAKIDITLLEASPRILSPLPEKIANLTRDQLLRRQINILTGKQVSQVSADAIHTKDGLIIPAKLKIWAAGIKAAPFLSQLELETNPRNQLLVKPTLQTTWDDNIFAFGDCAACPQPDIEHLVPPRAQAAHQQASLLAKSLKRALQDESLPIYYYRDYGSLITLSHHGTVGNLMGRAIGNVTLQGKLAKFAYLSLYRLHQASLFGWWKTSLLITAQLITSKIRARLKLH